MSDEIKPDKPFPEADDHDELSRQGDYVSGAIGNDGKDIIVGKNIESHRSKQRNQTQNINFRNPDNQIIWVELLKITTNIAELVTKLDGLPDRVGKLEVIVKPASTFERMVYILIALVLVVVVILIYLQLRR